MPQHFFLTKGKSKTMNSKNKKLTIKTTNTFLHPGKILKTLHITIILLPSLEKQNINLYLFALKCGEQEEREDSVPMLC